MKHKFLAAAVAALTLGGIAIGAAPGVASAHNQKFTPSCESLVINLNSYQVKRGDSYSNVADLSVDGVHVNSYPFNRNTTITYPWSLADSHTWVLTVDAYNTTNPNHVGPFDGSFQGDCVPDVEVTPRFTYTPPTCDAAGTAVPVKDDGVIWSEKDGVFTASPAEGYVFGENDQTSFGPFDLDQLTGEQCEPPTTEPPTTEPPVTTVPPTTVPPVTTVPPTTAPATAPATPLAVTGSNATNNILGVGFAALLAGGLAIWATRRKRTSDI